MGGKFNAEDILKNVCAEKPFRFSEHTTYGCGGLARGAYFPQSIRQTVAAYDVLSKRGKLAILGNGSNVLASDKFFDGYVICTKRLAGIVRTGENTVFCRAGTTIAALLKYCIANGLGGLEFLAGIPATCGGLALMNGGAAGKFIGDSIAYVKFYDGKIRNLPNNYCKFGHKYSIMRDINGIILGCVLNFTPCRGEKVAENIRGFLKARSGQPKGKSCGCVFKNHGGISAGEIIDGAGLKGLRIGSAEVSGQHANFIINSGESSSDVYALIKEVKRRVFENAGIRLEEEVVYIGDFNDFNG